MKKRLTMFEQQPDLDDPKSTSPICCWRVNQECMYGYVFMAKE